MTTLQRREAHPAAAPSESGAPADFATFIPRHIGPRGKDLDAMLAAVGVSSLDELIDQTLPASIRLNQPLNLPEPTSEFEALKELRSIAAKNQVFRSFIGMGYHGTITPPVIQRNILENPLWYTPYTPYQAEISQGRLEALLNFQTMVSDLTALPLANASLLDEATAAAEAMAMCVSIKGSGKPFLIAADCHPQTIAVVRTRAESLGVETRIIDAHAFSGVGLEGSCGILVQYPTTDGRIVDYSDLCESAHVAGAMVVAACDLLALTLIKPPGEWGGGGADIAVGTTQRFGVPMGYGGPHAAFMATKPEYARKMPGRIVGVSKDAHGNPAFRLSLQTREQHIRREKATSNICTAQVLLAVMASMYAVWHGPEGLKRIARKVHNHTRALAQALDHGGQKQGKHFTLLSSEFFDTLTIDTTDGEVSRIVAESVGRKINLRRLSSTRLAVAIDETTTRADVAELIDIFLEDAHGDASEVAVWEQAADRFGIGERARTSAFLTHPVFNSYHQEHELLRYITRLQRKDVSLADSMIPLGSCTMKLNAAAEMYPVTWPEFCHLHPFCPPEQAEGYRQLFNDLERWLAEITGFDAVSLQPNAGSQGEYAGLLAIRGYHHARGEKRRDVCLIPTSAHGTNPASAVIAGMRVVAVACDEQGNIDVADLRKKAEQHADDLSCLMITYPSTHGVFEEAVRDICAIVHEHGGQVYMDGANMNAQVALTSPGSIGADVCHLNLHKTFCIPHGGGGPGMGPIGVKAHLAPYLPGNPLSTDAAVGPVSAAPHGSATILPISWMYIRMMGEQGLRRATQVAILNANYMAERLKGHYDVVYAGKNGRVAHEFIIDCSHFEKTSGVRVEDIAKRLMDFGFHAPTMSWPVSGTLMIEPTESEPKQELDRLCDALIAIRGEVAAIEAGKLDREDNPLKHAPHTAPAVTSDAWPHKYGREQAAYPRPWVRDRKFWPSVGRIDNAYGDRNLVCTCPPMSDFCEA